MVEGRLDIDVLLYSPMTMLCTMRRWRHDDDDVDQDTEPRGDQHHLGVYADNPEQGHVDQEPSDHPDHLH